MSEKNEKRLIDWGSNFLFRKTKNGKCVFYPFGVFGFGYLLSKEKKIEVERILRINNSIFLPITILAAIVFKLYAFILVFCFGIIYIIEINRIVSGSEKLEERFKLNDANKKLAVSLGLSKCLLLMFCFLFMLGLSILSLFLPGGRLVSTFAILFFSLFLLDSIYLVKYSLESKKKFN